VRWELKGLADFPDYKYGVTFDEISGPPLNEPKATVTTGGLFTAGPTGDWLVTATDDAGRSASTTVTIEPLGAVFRYGGGGTATLSVDGKVLLTTLTPPDENFFLKDYLVDLGIDDSAEHEIEVRQLTSSPSYGDAFTLCLPHWPPVHYEIMQTQVTSNVNIYGGFQAPWPNPQRATLRIVVNIGPPN